MCFMCFESEDGENRTREISSFCITWLYWIEYIFFSVSFLGIETNSHSNESHLIIKALNSCSFCCTDEHYYYYSTLSSRATDAKITKTERWWTSGLCTVLVSLTSIQRNSSGSTFQLTFFGIKATFNWIRIWIPRRRRRKKTVQLLLEQQWTDLHFVDCAQFSHLNVTDNKVSCCCCCCAFSSRRPFDGQHKICLMLHHITSFDLSFLFASNALHFANVAHRFLHIRVIHFILNIIPLAIDVIY